MRETFVKRENSQREVREESVYGWEQLMFALYLLHLKAVVSKYLHEISDEQCHNQAIVCEIGHFRIARILFTTLFPESTFIIQQPSLLQAVMPRYRPPSRDRDARSTRTSLKQPQYTVQDLPPPSKYHLYNTYVHLQTDDKILIRYR